VEALELELEGARGDCKDLNSQLDQAESEVATARLKIKETEQQLAAARTELDGVTFIRPLWNDCK